ncbi:MAG: hypothetical protein MZV70_75450 [Desulfobacterales bacterium]|nr:hypothetical protein [Desulfobacterales bacterium]
MKTDADVRASTWRAARYDGARSGGPEGHLQGVRVLVAHPGPEGQGQRPQAVEYGSSRPQRRCTALVRRIEKARRVSPCTWSCTSEASPCTPSLRGSALSLAPGESLITFPSRPGRGPEGAAPLARSLPSRAFPGSL